MATEKKSSKLQGLSALMFQLSIRLRLLWIWFIKNIKVWIKIITIIAVIMVACGLISGELNGVGEYEALGKTIDWLAGIGGSIAYTAYAIVKKTKKVLLTDIKSRSLKIAMIKANLYFDENGKICKRIEAKTNLDINGDGKIGDSEAESEDENLIEGIVRSANELHTILTTPIDPNATDEDIVEEAELTQPEADEADEEATENVDGETEESSDDNAETDVENITDDDIKQSRAERKAAKKAAKAAKAAKKAEKAESEPKTKIGKAWAGLTAKIGVKMAETKKVMSKSKDIIFEKKAKPAKPETEGAKSEIDESSSKAAESGIEIIETDSSIAKISSGSASADASDTRYESAAAEAQTKSAPAQKHKKSAKDLEIESLLKDI